jgi:hypothetical protein
MGHRPPMSRGGRTAASGHCDPFQREAMTAVRERSHLDILHGPLSRPRFRDNARATPPGAARPHVQSRLNRIPVAAMTIRHGTSSTHCLSVPILCNRRDAVKPGPTGPRFLRLRA